jgi:phospholipase/carboxylesterase
MQQQTVCVAGLDTCIVTPRPGLRTSVVLLHGYAMAVEDLAPFAHSLNVPAIFFFPRGPHAVAPRGRAWWTIDAPARAADQRAGSRDLALQCPAGLDAARAHLDAFMAELNSNYLQTDVVLGGFSQGAMLACDWLLHSQAQLRGLALMSASRLNLSAWRQRRERLRDLPVFVSHGHSDRDLSYSAGEALKDFLGSSGAAVTWQPYEGGHEIPLIVWRQLRRFLNQLAAG